MLPVIGGGLMYSKHKGLLIGVILLLLVVIAPSIALGQPTTYAGVTFPLGDLSFADLVVSYVAASCVDQAYADPTAALGPPDCYDDPCHSYDGCVPCAVALGFRVSELDNRGFLVLKFTDNVLRDVPGEDLFIYTTNDRICRVEIGTNNGNYIPVGEVSGYPAGIDIAPFVTPSERFFYVRLTDVPADEDPTPCSGPSIDAVGAMGDPIAVQERGEVLGSLELLPAGELALSIGGAPENLLIILDTSTSMDESFEGSTKIQVAKRVLSEVVSELPEGMQVGLRIFGGCERSRLMLPISPLDREELSGKIQEEVTTGGATPLAFSIEQAEGDFADIKDKKLILLVSDGMETCHGDPVKAAQTLVSHYNDLRIDVIGFDVAGQDGTADQLRKIADATHGSYFAAQSSQQLKIAMQSIINVRYQVFDAQGEKVFEGIIGEEGPQLAPGTYSVVVLGTPALVVDSVIVRPGETTKYEVTRTNTGYSANPQQ
jgi:hypothetical protein